MDAAEEAFVATFFQSDPQQRDSEVLAFRGLNDAFFKIKDFSVDGLKPKQDLEPLSVKDYGDQYDPNVSFRLGGENVW